MTVKLYIGNIAFAATKEELTHLFSQVGNVISSRIICDRETGKSRGFGFIEMAQDSEAKAAIEQFNGFILHGRHLVVHRNVSVSRGFFEVSS